MTQLDVTEETAPEVLSALPNGENALDPVISASTISFHYGKHDRGNVATLQTLIADTTLADLSLGAIILETAGKTEKVTVFNDAAQEWNHTFCWRSLGPNGGAEPAANLRQRIQDCFGSVDACKEALATAAAAHFGRGWTCLVLEDDRLKVLNATNAQTPSTSGARPLLAVEVWQHPYYLDYHDRRSEYVNAVLDNLIKWSFAAESLGAPIDVPERGEQS